MKKILVIEDNTDIRENVEELLLLEGYTVLTAEDGRDGADKAIRETPDLILCDVSMPGMDGYGVLKHVRQHSQTHPPVFIFLTARAEKADVQRGLGEGAQAYLIKPFTAEELTAVVAAQLHATPGFFF